MTKFIEIQARVVSGMRIQEAAQEAVETANRLGVQIALEFKGRKYSVYPKLTNAEALVEIILDGLTKEE